MSIPPKARIYVENQYQGETPIELNRFAGTYKIRAQLRGYEIVSRPVTIIAGKKTTEEFTLAKNSGSIELTTEPGDVKVFLDGEEIGSTKVKTDESDRVSEQMNIDLVSAGSHHLQLTKKGFFSKDTTVTVEKDKTAPAHRGA